MALTNLRDTADFDGFASAGEVSADGETQLLAGDRVLVPGEPARDHLTAAAGDLVAALRGSGSA